MPLISVGSSNTVFANSSNTVLSGTSLENAVFAKITSGTREVLMVDYVANSTAPYFISPSLSDVIASGVKFSSTANLKLLDAQSNVVAWRIVTLSPQTGNSVHNVTDVSQNTDSGSLYYGQSPAVEVGDQILYDSRSANSYNVSIDSQGFITIDSSVDANDSFNYRIWEAGSEVWGTSGTYSFLGAGGTVQYISKNIRMYIRVV